MIHSPDQQSDQTIDIRHTERDRKLPLNQLLESVLFNVKFLEMGDSESGVFDSSIPNGIVLVSNEKLESFETIPN